MHDGDGSDGARRAEAAVAGSDGAPAAGAIFEIKDEDVEEPTAGLPGVCLDLGAADKRLKWWGLQFLDLDVQHEFVRQPVPDDACDKTV